MLYNREKGMRVMCFDTIAANSVCYYINKPGCIIVDIRDASDYSKGHIPSAINIPYDNLQTYTNYLSRYNEVILYCSRGNKSLLAAKSLRLGHGKAISLYGGLHAYRGDLE